MKPIIVLTVLLIAQLTGCRTTPQPPRPVVVIEAQKTEHQPATIAARIIFN